MTVLQHQIAEDTIPVRFKRLRLEEVFSSACVTTRSFDRHLLEARPGHMTIRIAGHEERPTHKRTLNDGAVNTITENLWGAGIAQLLVDRVKTDFCINR